MLRTMLEWKLFSQSQIMKENDIPFLFSTQRSDTFVIGIVAIFSLSSGYLTVLIYEYASNDCDKPTQAAATGLLNLSFQVLYS
jgi:hypothetical protein